MRWQLQHRCLLQAYLLLQTALQQMVCLQHAAPAQALAWAAQHIVGAVTALDHDAAPAVNLAAAGAACAVTQLPRTMLRVACLVDVPPMACVLD